MPNALAESALVALGLLHFLQIPVTSLLMRTTFELDLELGRLSPLFRRLVRLFMWGLMLLLTGLGALVAAYPSEVQASRLGQGLCLLLAALFVARLVAHTTLFALWPQGAANRGAYFALAALYGVLGVGYLAVSLISS